MLHNTFCLGYQFQLRKHHLHFMANSLSKSNPLAFVMHTKPTAKQF